MTEEHEQDTPFNFAMLYYLGLSKLQEKKIEDKELGTAYYYQSLKNVYIRISFRLTKSEKEMIETLFKKAKAIIKSPIDRRLQNQMQPMLDSQALEILEEIDIMLWDYMNKYKMIFPRIKADTGMKALKKRFDLDGTNNN